MSEFSENYQANVEYFDSLFGIGKNYDFISRELGIPGHRARFYYIDSFSGSISTSVGLKRYPRPTR